MAAGKGLALQREEVATAEAKVAMVVEETRAAPEEVVVAPRPTKNTLL